ncbi:unnamed protein product [Sympodiomycopsis kandeliae]
MDNLGSHPPTSSLTLSLLHGHYLSTWPSFGSGITLFGSNTTVVFLSARPHHHVPYSINASVLSHLLTHTVPFVSSLSESCLNQS